VTREEHIDYFTAMSGSGTAFPALLAEAMMNDAIGRGVPPDVARRVAQVIVGAGRLPEHDGASPSDTVKAFVDYKGTTAAGIVAMRENGFDTAVGAGLEAAYRKALTLSAKQASGTDAKHCRRGARAAASARLARLPIAPGSPGGR